MNAFTAGSLKLGSVFGVLVGLIYYGASSDDASSGDPLMQSVGAGVAVMLTISGIMIGLRRLIVGKEGPNESDDDIPDDPFGLDRGVTAKTFGGGLVQAFLRSCRDDRRATKTKPNKSP